MYGQLNKCMVTLYLRIYVACRYVQMHYVDVQMHDVDCTHLETRVTCHIRLQRHKVFNFLNVLM